MYKYNIDSKTQPGNFSTCHMKAQIVTYLKHYSKFQHKNQLNYHESQSISPRKPKFISALWGKSKPGIPAFISGLPKLRS